MKRSQSLWFGTTLLLALSIKGTLCNDNNFFIRSNQIGASQRHRRQQTNVFDQDQSDTTGISSRQSQVNNCELNSNGYYGTIDTTSDIYDIQYLYQVSVVSGTTALQLSTDIIRPLDFAITTAILPKFFDCSRRRRRVEERLLQDNGTIFAITSTPIDTYISSDRLPCPKVIANSDCYVVQGLSTAIATGFRDADVVSAAFQDAVNAVLQENTIVPNLGISTIIDVTALADTTDVAPPVNIQPQTPIPVSSAVPILAPITNPPIAIPVVSPVPVDTRSPITITFAPIPSIPPAPMPNMLNLPSISTPIAPSTPPTIKPDSTSTSSDVPSAVPTMPMDDETTASPNKINLPVNNDEDNTVREESSNEKDGLKWWAWILIVLGILCVIFCGYSVWTNRDITTTPPSGDRSDIGSSTVGILSSNPTKQSSRNKDSSISNKKGKLGKSNNNNDPHDTEDDEEIPYEPPPGMDLYVPPPSTFTNNDTNTSSNNNNNNQNTSSANRDYHITAPPIPPAPPLFSNPTPVLVTPPSFINDDNNDDDDDEEDDDDDDEEEIEYERDENDDDDGEYTDDDDDEVEGEEHNYHHNNDGDDEVFEDEESYYEEEEDDDDDVDYVDDNGAYRNTSNTNEWGDKSPSFGELY